MEKLPSFDQFLNESRTLTREDNVYVRGIESIMNRYKNDPSYSRMEAVKSHYLKGNKTYRDLSSKELMQFNIDIQHCINIKPTSNDISAMVAAFPHWNKD